ncbi:TPA: signal recognition particle-docking protein FtsY [Candidatus Latescibacteria bacterium]|nr:signal recognition particle-docking protein FtsY [Candidatus Latescibacterota bacterium]
MLGGLLDKFKEGLTKTRDGVFNRIRDVVRGKPRLDEDTLEEIEEILIQADVGVDPTLRIIDRLRERYADVEDVESAVFELLEEEIGSILSASVPFSLDASPTVILIVGVNGAGKTTTIGKLAKRFSDEGKKVLIAACDTFRAAAIDQIEVWANRAGAHMVRHQSGADAASVAFDALEAAKARNADIVLIDTAGRLHTKVNLMEEVKKIGRVVGKAIEGAPHETLLVIDATTGQNAIEQARAFHQHLTLTGLVLAKLDGTAKGGIVIAVSDELEIPVRLVGLGEGENDLREFDPKAFTEALLS